ncbi:AraC family transcriptional regulator [Lichenicoccus sp.]|uniref:helix-turn-helix transcriptional regulator n=1 Tax=Lichenicoccus sp. TaxID=2781899 RepID=UPI003D0A3405
MISKRTHIVAQHRSALPGVEAMTLLTDHAFPRHSHDGFGIGVMAAGAQRSWSGIGWVEAEAGDVITVNPGEMHDGVPIGGTRGWQMLYLYPSVVASALLDEGEDQLELTRPALRDPILARLFACLFARATAVVPEPLALEEDLLRMLAWLARRHGTRQRLVPSESPAVAMARRRLDGAPESPVTLAELAALSGVSRFQFLRGFARQTGVTPHAYLLQRRVRLARQLLVAGRTPAEVAQEAGFADQSHMTRAFCRQFGVTPARYQAAVA